ncbi:MAG TPA: lipid-binding SYLF domain-containing protein [Steroidobacteraceae bacterium]|nr:lipid-binding SYLF domain-containing protein [Steroidobacteraceae bacterium]
MRRLLALTLSAVLTLSAARADTTPDSDTIALFRNAGTSAGFFSNCYGYAVFPTVGQGAFMLGGAYGQGRVYEHEQYVGDVSVTQLSLGFQIGGRGYSMIIFLQDKRAFDEFTGGNFEFGADATAVAITAGASGQVGTTGANAAASGGMKDAHTAGRYYKGVAVFTIVKGGAMVAAAVAGQKFKYTARH